jgi:hypothetical protein
VGKYGTAGQTTNNNVVRRMRCTFRTNKATDTHLEHVILIAFPQHWLFKSVRRPDPGCSLIRRPTLLLEDYFITKILHIRTSMPWSTNWYLPLKYYNSHTDIAYVTNDFRYMPKKLTSLMTAYI